MDFDAAFSQLISVEAGFQNNPKDRGNWTGGTVGNGLCKGTKYGISASAYPAEDIGNLALERAKLLYRRDYWGPAGCDAVPDALKYDLFDTAVNSGYKTAVKLLQRACGEPADGALGPHTLQAIQSMAPTRLQARFDGWRLEYLTEADGWDTFGKGWARRVAKNLKAV